MPGEKYNEYIETDSKTTQLDIQKAIDKAKWIEIKNINSDLNDLKFNNILWWKKVDFKVPDYIDNFYKLEWNRIIFNLEQIKNYLQVVYQRLQWIKNQKFWEISKENNFTWTILAIQIALKAIDSKKYNIWKIDGEYNETTKQAIRQFQSDSKLTRQDWKPWKETIWTLVKSLQDFINNKKLETNEQEVLKKDITDIIEESCINNPYSWAYTPERKEEIINYILEWKLRSWNNSLIEMQITNLSQDAISEDFVKNWKLKYLIEHSNEPLKTNIQNIKEIENNILNEERKNNWNSFYWIKLDKHKAYTVDWVSNRPQWKTSSWAFKNCRLTKRLWKVWLNTTIIEHNWVRINRAKYHEETWYSQKVLPWRWLEKFKWLEWRHVAEDGTIRDKDWYIVVAANLNYAPRDSIVMTSLWPGKVYDTWDLPKWRFDIYVNR